MCQPGDGHDRMGEIAAQAIPPCQSIRMAAILLYAAYAAHVKTDPENGEGRFLVELTGSLSQSLDPSNPNHVEQEHFEETLEGFESYEQVVETSENACDAIVKALSVARTLFTDEYGPGEWLVAQGLAYPGGIKERMRKTYDEVQEQFCEENGREYLRLFSEDGSEMLYVRGQQSSDKSVEQTIEDLLRDLEDLPTTDEPEL